MKRSYFLLITLLSISFTSINATSWLGGVGSWDDATKWDTGTIPTITDDVTIDNGDVTVSDIGAAHSIVLNGIGTLTIGFEGELSIISSVGVGLTLNGPTVEFTNNGYCTISNSTQNGILTTQAISFINNGYLEINGTMGSFSGIENHIHFINGIEAEIFIDNTSNNAITNSLGNQLFDNQGSIYIGENSIMGHGVYNSAKFNNTGQLLIAQDGSPIEKSGIYNDVNAVKFDNNRGVIEIYNAGDTYPSIVNKSLFINQHQADLAIFDGVLHGIDNIGTFTNKDTANITIFLSSSNSTLNNAIFNRTGAIFNNFTKGVINLGETVGDALLNDGTFNNLNKINIGSDGTQVLGNGITNNMDFFNYGRITIDNTNGNGIENTRLFTNSNDIIILNITGGVGIFNNSIAQAVFMNTGDIDIAKYNASYLNNRGIDNNGSFTNSQSGKIEIGNILSEGIFTTAGVFSNKGTYKHLLNESYWSIAGHATNDNEFINENSGKVFSHGHIDGNNYTNRGELNPGSSPGITYLHNNLKDSPGSNLVIEIGGTSRIETYDVISLNDLANNDITGTELNVVLYNNFVPSIGDQFHIVEGNGFTGTFSSENLVPLPSNMSWIVDYTSVPNEIILKVISALPVTLIDLTAKVKDGQSILQWSTASEINNKGFSIEHSTDHNHWISIGYQEGVGNSTSINKYEYTDKTPIEDANYYRLAQTDKDGTINYSPTVFTIISSLKTPIVLSPNPIQEFLFIDHLVGDKTSIKIINMVGVTIYQENRIQSKLDLSFLQKGAYIIQINYSNKTTYQKIIKG